LNLKKGYDSIVLPVLRSLGLIPKESITSKVQKSRFVRAVSTLIDPNQIYFWISCFVFLSPFIYHFLNSEYGKALFRRALKTETSPGFFLYEALNKTMDNNNAKDLNNLEHLKSQMNVNAAEAKANSNFQKQELSNVRAALRDTEIKAVKNDKLQDYSFYKESLNHQQTFFEAKSVSKDLVDCKKSHEILAQVCIANDKLHLLNPVEHAFVQNNIKPGVELAQKLLDLPFLAQSSAPGLAEPILSELLVSTPTNFFFLF
jgi:hypothetical protein